MDKIDTLNQRLLEVVEKYNSLKESGMDEEILIIYLTSKCKLSKQKVMLLLKNVDEFYNKLIKKEMLVAFEK